MPLNCTVLECLSASILLSSWSTLCPINTHLPTKYVIWVSDLNFIFWKISLSEFWLEIGPEFWTIFQMALSTFCYFSISMFVCKHVYTDTHLHTCISQRQMLGDFLIHFPLRLFYVVNWLLFYCCDKSSWPRQLTERWVCLILQFSRGLGSIMDHG